MDTSILKRSIIPILLVIGLTMMLGSLYLLSEATQRSTEFEDLHQWLLLLNIAGVVILLIVIGINLYKLIRQYRSHIPGSRLTARLVGMFVILSVVPVILVYYFSLQFLSRGIDNWFDVRVEEALNNSLELSRTALDGRVRELSSRTERLARQLEDLSPAEITRELDDLRLEGGAEELTVFGNHSRILATSTSRAGNVLPDRPTQEILLQLRQGRPYVSLDPLDNEGLFIRALYPIATGGPGGDTRILQALYPIAERQSALAQNVQEAYRKYRELLFYRDPIKYSFILTLSLILLLSLLTAVWGAFFSARRLVAPIQDLAAGTQAVARGDFDMRLPMPARDEVGFLVLSFNEMTARLAEAREQASRSQHQVENERAYLEAVLTRLSSGVVAFDSDFRLRAFNAAASEILDVDLERYLGLHLTNRHIDEPMLREMLKVCQEHENAGEREWREELALKGAHGRRILTCSCAALPGDDRNPDGGHVLVFDDLTTLIQAQRDAAWGEVARRLAHEIKNPLTPIQLAAERIRHRCLDKLAPEDRRVLDRATHTIGQQVDAMKAMVNAFSEYARTPDLNPRPLDLNQLVGEVADLYRGRASGIRMRLDLDPELPEVEADAGRMRQMFHNLIKNAREATTQQESAGEVAIATRYQRDDGDTPQVEVRVMDNGPGFESDILGQVFDPYVTSKPRGTGLGLAIVKKLVEEHGGTIRAANRAEGGAELIVTLPVNEDAQANMLLRSARNGSGNQRGSL